MDVSSDLRAARSRRQRRRAVAVLAVCATVAATLVLGAANVPEASAAPGHPGVPAAPTALYSEDFENGTGVTELENYVSDTGATYTASSYYLNQYRCNGFITSSAYTRPDKSYCNNAGQFTVVGYQAQALGLLSTPSNTANRAVSSYTAGNADTQGTANDGLIEPPNQIQFATVNQLALPAANRFVTFSVDASATSCSGTPPLNPPLLHFYLRNDAGNLTAVSRDAINPCTAAGGATTTIQGNVVRYGRYPAMGSILLTGNSLGIVMVNEQNESSPNDGAFDNIQVLDVTPQLDKSFSPARVPAGGVSTLTLTVTNTSELAAKNGWSFTDNLPAGLVIATTPALGGTCIATRAAAAGGSTVSVTGGQLTAGQTSCTITVNVTSNTPGPSDAISKTYTNGASNFSNVVGMNLPGPATVEFYREPAITIAKTASPTTVTAPGQTVDYTFLITNSGNTMLTNVGATESAFTGTGTEPAVTCPAVASLAPAAQLTCTGSYTTTQADVDAGGITNTAVATGAPPSGPAVTSEPSNATVTATRAPALSVVKSATPADSASFTVGQVITYTFVVTNTGNVTLTDPSIAETSFTGSGPISAPSCPAGALDPGAQIRCTTTYTLTQADVDNESVTNTATATATPPSGVTPPTSPPSTVTVPVPPAPGLSLVKSADPATITAADQAVTYSFLVTNTGNVTLTNTTVGETAFSGTGTAPAIDCPPAASSLAPGEQVTCTATYTTTQSDVDAGMVTNAAYASASPPTGPVVDSPPSTAAVTATQSPSITVVKSATPTNAAAYTAGQVVSYSFLVTNTGNVTLADVGVTERAFTGSGGAPQISCPAAASSLAPGAQVTCTASYTLTQADIDRGSTENTATATGTPPTGMPPVSPPSTVTTPATPASAITVVKGADRTSITAAGDAVHYSFLVTNTGNVTLTNVAVMEGTFSGAGTPPTVTCPAGAASLAPSAQITCTADYVTTQADVDSGALTNTATATGTPPSGTSPISPPSTVTIASEHTPSIALVKSATPAAIAANGDQVTYSFLVTNTGNVTLSNVGVTETAFTGTGTPLAITCPDEAASLAPNGSVTCTASYAATQADVDAGLVANTATAIGTPSSGAAVTSAPSTAVVTASAAPRITVVKSADPFDAAHFAVDQLVTYSYVVTNTGNVTLSNVTVDEGTFTGSGTLSPITCPAEATSLAPGAQVTCTAAYTITQTDLDRGSITNTATATGTPPSGQPPVSPQSEVTVPSDPAPAITVVKTADLTQITAPGQTITYSFLVTNTGNVTLTDARVTEGPFTGAGTLSPASCPAAAASLAPGAQMVCTATYTVAQADIDAGSVTNTATATGTPPSGASPVSPPSTATVTATTTPSIALVKTATPSTVTRAGEQVTYSFTVTNTGDVTLTTVGVAEATFTGTGQTPAIICPPGAASLAPHAVVTCTAIYTVTQADADAGQIANTAVATGTPSRGASVTSDPSSATVTVPVDPALTVVKSASPSDEEHFAAGQAITYSFVVTNTGNTTLADVTVTDGAFTGTGILSPVTCPAGARSLIPGEQVTCTATYTITQADVDAGSITNHATASGEPPRGTPPVSPPSTVTVPTPQHPAVSVLKSADRTTVTAPGQVITYSFLVTNTGQVTLTEPIVREGSFNGAGQLSAVQCPSGVASLLPGAQATCTATYTVRAADLNGRALTNTATVTADPPGSGAPISSTPSTARVSIQPGAAVETGGRVIASAGGPAIWVWVLLAVLGLAAAMTASVLARPRRRKAAR